MSELIFTRTCAALVLITLAGCIETPSDGFEAFFSGMARGTDEAYERLSPRAQDEVARAARARGEDPAKALVKNPPRTTLRKIVVVEEHEATATLEVTDALGQSEKVSMVKVDGRWKVDAPP